ncbi:hypothetical protein RclHR1_00120029 [Rhizophagus clarus]|uniref:BTB domain-containing protein n=1 Tax=Rhizophagus clarus TaxID=94130 RepID=A0A2Z6Q7F1_9GLOM|nr:hypothetical protein RclHR1_00120029 [Rhizophagus clarus]
MSTQFFSKLSKNYIELLKDDEYYDVTIEVGEDPNVKIFRAHMNILCYRSPYLKRNLAFNKKNNDNSLVHIKLSKISSEIFQIILEYIYGGIISLNDQDILDIINILIAADVLHLQELVDHLQTYLIENKPEQIEQHFEFIQQISSQSINLLELQEFCISLMAKFPDKILKSFNFTSLSETSLISLIKRDDLQMKEVEVWDRVLKWGLAQNPTLISDPGTWSDNDFVIMRNILQQCLPLINFFNLSSKEFSQKVRPYRKLLSDQLYEDLLNFYLDPEIVSTLEILRPRKTALFSNGTLIIDSRIVDSSIYLPYKFELLLRGSRDGFTPKKFHELCDDKPNTVTFIKIKGTKEILGGYNPIIWKSFVDKSRLTLNSPDDFGGYHTRKSFSVKSRSKNSSGNFGGYRKSFNGWNQLMLSNPYNLMSSVNKNSSDNRNSSDNWGKTEDSFIFSFKDNNIKDAIISNVKNTNRALKYDPCRGPQFGVDIVCVTSDLSTSKDYNHIYCKKSYYEKAIRNTADKFSMEDYEVFQIIKR